MKTEILPQESSRAEAFSLWMSSPMPMVTLVKTMNVTPLLKMRKKSGIKFTALMCWCIGRAASRIEEFYLLPEEGKLFRYDKLVINVIVGNKQGGINFCDVPFSDDLEQFSRDYLELTQRAAMECKSSFIEDCMNIGTPYKEMLKALQYSENESTNDFHFAVTNALKQNLPPRLRMAVLYAVAQGVPNGGRVINTCNRSEDYVGYSTKFGDSAGDVAPLASYTVTEVLAIGDILDLPKNLVHKAPSDGFCGKTDEDNLGFTYAVLDKYIMTGECEDETVKANIDRRHELNKHKLELLPVVER